MPATTGKALVACGERRCLSRRDQARIANPAAHQQSGAIKARGSVDQSGFASGISMSMTSASRNDRDEHRANQYLPPTPDEPADNETRHENRPTRQTANQLREKPDD